MQSQHETFYRLGDQESGEVCFMHCELVDWVADWQADHILVMRFTTSVGVLESLCVRGDFSPQDSCLAHTTI